MHQTALAALTAACLLCSCAVVKVEPQGRVASDQLLVSLAVEDAVRALDIRPAVSDRAVRLNVVHVGTVAEDLSYLKQALRARVLQSGGRVVTEAGEEDVELVAMVQALGSDSDQASVGLPVPLPSVGEVTMSEITFYSDSKQIARCRLWLFAVDRSGRLVFTHAPVHHAHRIRNPVLLGVTLGKASDIRELDRGRGEIETTTPGLTREDTPQD